jgi:hypothetical protein
MKTKEEYLGLAVRLARQNVENSRGRPFGAVPRRDGCVIYAEIAKPLAQQGMKIECVPVREDDHLYELWQRTLS